MPIDDFTSWRAACRQLLEAADFALVDKEFLTAFHATTVQFAAGAISDEETICAHTRSLIADSDWMPEVMARVRGCQVACFHGGYLMKTNLDALCSARVSRVRLDDQAIDLIERYATPRYGAAAVIVAASGATLQDIVAINLDDIRDDGGEVSVAGAEYTIPRRAARIIDALACERLFYRATSTDPLFVYVQGTGRKHGTLVRWTPRGMFDSLKKMERETGLLLTTHLRDVGHRDAISWAHRRGISLQSLEPRRMLRA